MRQVSNSPSRFEYIAKGIVAGFVPCIFSPWQIWINTALGGLVGFAFYLKQAKQGWQASALCLFLAAALAVYSFSPNSPGNFLLSTNWFPGQHLPLLGIESVLLFLLSIRFAFLSYK